LASLRFADTLPPPAEVVELPPDECGKTEPFVPEDDAWAASFVEERARVAARFSEGTMNEVAPGARRPDEISIAHGLPRIGGRRHAVDDDERSVARISPTPEVRVTLLGVL
jgi:hypothetical protein